MSDETPEDPPSAEAPPPPGRRNLYGRRRSHKLRGGRRRLMEEALDALRAMPPGGGDLSEISLEALFPKARGVHLEIGFGGGEHLAAMAAQYPDIGFLGAEHYVDGVGKLLSQIDRRALSNVRIHPHNARDLIDALPVGSLDRIYLLYPDPWPKKRHRKRRFVTAETVDDFALKLKLGGDVRVASDIDDYIAHTLEAFHGRPAFRWTAERARDFAEPWADWPGTRYEAKALREGRAPTYLTFQRV